MHLNPGRRPMRLAMRVGVPMAMLLTVGALALGVPRLAPVNAQPGGGPRTDLKNFQHVFIIMMENTGYNALIGNTNAPWINQATQTYGVATNYYGTTHPSQPNYIAATSGAHETVPDDNDITINAQNIVDQLESHGKSWKAYMQAYSYCVTPLDHSCGVPAVDGKQLYERKHNPFISYQDVQSNSARVAKIVDLSQLDTDLANNTVPDYVWISPDQCHDMHGIGTSDPNNLCGFAHEQNLIATGDAFLSDTVGKIMASRAWTGNSVIFVTWDESDFTGSKTDFGFGDTSGCCAANPGGGHVLTLVISHSDHTARQSSVAYNHYSMLATIQGGWGLGCLANTCDTANVPPMSDLVGPKG